MKASKREKQVDCIIQNAVYHWQIPIQQLSVVSRAGKLAAGSDGPVDEAAIRAAVVAVLEVVAVRS